MSDTPGDSQSVGHAYLAESRRRLSACHEKIKHCVGQLDDDQAWWRPFESMNSIANIVLHLCGNLRQWIVSAAGGAVDNRNRPREFAEREPIVRDELLRRLATVVGEADGVLARTDPACLLEPRRIQGFEETVLTAIFDSLAHLNGHTQEIVYITRMQLGDAYRFAWTPTTAEEGAAAKDLPGVETVAVRDATFEEMPAHPLAPAPFTEIAGPETPPAPAESAAQHESPLDDYLLKFEQEFQDDEEQGKV